MAGCTGHKGHKGVKAKKPKGAAKKACAVKLQREKSNLKAANKYLKKKFG